MNQNHRPDSCPKNYREVLASLGVVLAPTKGGSMRPLIVQGKGYVGIVAVDEPRIGDILLFEQRRAAESVYILHRLVHIDQTGDTPVYVTRGDNCLVCERVLRDDIIGRAEMIYWTRGAGSWMPRLLHARRETDGTRALCVSDRAYKIYSRLWMVSWPVRRLWYRLRSRLRSIIDTTPA